MILCCCYRSLFFWLAQNSGAFVGKRCAVVTLSLEPLVLQTAFLQHPKQLPEFNTADHFRFASESLLLFLSLLLGVLFIDLSSFGLHALGAILIELKLFFLEVLFQFLNFDEVHQPLELVFVPS